ncbi:MAG: hypothetical protein AABZ39_06945 [Spirochaetota bacterium]
MKRIFCSLVLASYAMLTIGCSTSIINPFTLLNGALPVEPYNDSIPKYQFTVLSNYSWISGFQAYSCCSDGTYVWLLIVGAGDYRPGYAITKRQLVNGNVVWTNAYKISNDTIMAVLTNNPPATTTPNIGFTAITYDNGMIYAVTPWQNDTRIYRLSANDGSVIDYISKYSYASYGVGVRSNEYWTIYGTLEFPYYKGLSGVARTGANGIIDMYLETGIIGKFEGTNNSFSYGSTCAVLPGNGSLSIAKNYDYGTISKYYLYKINSRTMKYSEWAVPLVTTKAGFYSTIKGASFCAVGNDYLFFARDSDSVLSLIRE